MSKPTARVVLGTLIALVLSQQPIHRAGRFAKAETAGVRLTWSVVCRRTLITTVPQSMELNAFQLQNYAPSQPGAGRNEGGCSLRWQTSPLD